MAMPAIGHDETAEQLRDRLTIQWLSRAVEGLPDVQLEDFVANWWDGQAHEPCLVVRFGAGSRRRVIETGGEAVVVPMSRRRAGRQLAARRAPRTIELGVPTQRHIGDVVVDAEDDAVRCEAAGCGAMRPTEVNGPCPRCGSN